MQSSKQFSQQEARKIIHGGVKKRQARHELMTLFDLGETVFIIPNSENVQFISRDERRMLLSKHDLIRRSTIQCGKFGLVPINDFIANRLKGQK